MNNCCQVQVTSTCFHKKGKKHFFLNLLFSNPYPKNYRLCLLAICRYQQQVVYTGQYSETYLNLFGRSVYEAIPQSPTHPKLASVWWIRNVLFRFGSNFSFQFGSRTKFYWVLMGKFWVKLKNLQWCILSFFHCVILYLYLCRYLVYPANEMTTFLKVSVRQNYS